MVKKAPEMWKQLEVGFFFFLETTFPLTIAYRNITQQARKGDEMSEDSDSPESKIEPNYQDKYSNENKKPEKRMIEVQSINSTFYQKVTSPFPGHINMPN